MGGGCLQIFFATSRMNVIFHVTSKISDPYVIASTMISAATCDVKDWRGMLEGGMLEDFRNFNGNKIRSFAICILIGWRMRRSNCLAKVLTSLPTSLWLSLWVHGTMVFITLGVSQVPDARLRPDQAAQCSISPPRAALCYCLIKRTWFECVSCVLTVLEKRRWNTIVDQ